MDPSQPFTVSRNTIFKALIFTPSTGWSVWLVSLFGMILIAIGSIVDMRYLILGLIVVLTIIPALAFFLFVKYMFATEIVANLLHHTVERKSDGYVVHIFRPADHEDPLEKDKTWIENGRLSLFDSNVVKTKTTVDYDIVFFKDSPLGILYVPRY